jgi:hypothetical protein
MRNTRIELVSLVWKTSMLPLALISQIGPSGIEPLLQLYQSCFLPLKDSPKNKKPSEGFEPTQSYLQDRLPCQFGVDGTVRCSTIELGGSIKIKLPPQDSNLQPSD